MSLDAIVNWLFNFALGLFVPPALLNITYKIFIVIGFLCFGTAIQAYFTYLGTCGTTLESIELLFAKGGPSPWKTSKGGSRFDAEIQAVMERKNGGTDLYEHRPIDENDNRGSEEK
jgi:hypothetical protein